MRQVTPKPTSSRLVKAKARVALVIFWICRSRFFFFSPLWGHRAWNTGAGVGWGAWGHGALWGGEGGPWGGGPWRIDSPRKSGPGSHSLWTMQDLDTTAK